MKPGRHHVARRLLNWLSAFSLLLCILTLLAWIPGNWRTFGWAWGDATVATRHWIVLTGNAFRVGKQSGVRPPPVVVGNGGTAFTTTTIIASRDILGFHYQRAVNVLTFDSKTTLPGTYGDSLEFWINTVWCMPVALSLSIYFVGWPARRWARAKWSARVGLCRKCGYDLRASKVKCPECGELIPITAPNPNGA